MFENIEKIQLLNCSQGISPTYRKIVARKNHVLNFRVKGTAFFEFPDHKYTVRAGEMIYIPQGSSYVFSTPEGEPSGSLSISFRAVMENPKPKVYPMEVIPEAGEIFNHLVPMWHSGGTAERLKCQSVFYGILSKLAAIESADYATRKKSGIIAPAVEFLREHIFDSSLRADQLHGLCGISGTYFRKIFLSEFGISPQQYIIHKRLTQAKSLLDSGEYTSVSQVAAAVGYSDPLYFSRAFREKYGFSPIRSIREG